VIRRLLRPRRPRRAYTLVEVALAVAVGTILMLVILELLRKSSRMFSQRNEKLDALQSATMISEIMHRDMRYMVIPLVKPPAEAAPEIVAATNPDPTDPTAPTPAPTPAAPAATTSFDADGSKELLLPFSSDSGERAEAKPFWNAERARPDAAGAILFDLTDGPGNTKDPTKEFTFYRTKLDTGSGGLFGTGASTANYQLLKVTYKALGSGRYEDPRLYVLERTVQPVRLEISPDRTQVVDDGDAESRRYTMFYFRRLLITLHEAPEAGVLGGGNASNNSPSGIVPTVVSAIADAITGSNPDADAEVPFDAIYFARIMIAGASAGSGARVVAKAGEKPSSRRQNLDLLVNLIHLDGVTDRFRGRSLARNWNAELPVEE
jgi:hypothetical protein